MYIVSDVSDTEYMHRVRYVSDTEYMHCVMCQ